MRVLRTMALQGKLYPLQWKMAQMLYKVNGLQSAEEYITGLVDRGMTNAGQISLPGFER